MELTWPQLVTVRENFVREIREGLSRESKSSMAMVPSLVTALPSGDEVGECVALDIGGSNLRVLLVRLRGQGAFETLAVVKKSISPELQSGDGVALFDFIAAAVKELLDQVPQVAKGEVQLGFTFSFPLQQLAINSGVLTKWTKGFSASGVVGQDVCALLAASFERLGLKVRVAALLNDTVGTMITGCYEQRTQEATEAGCIIGLILGTGTNACYWEQRDSITKLDATTAATAQGMVINMECGNFGSRADRIGLDLPLTAYDAQLNAESKNKDAQLIEKQISGMYLGEIVRLVLRKAMAQGKLFASSTAALATPYAFTTEMLAQIEADTAHDMPNTADILSALGVVPSTLSERLFGPSSPSSCSSSSLASHRLLSPLSAPGREPGGASIGASGSGEGSGDYASDRPQGLECAGGGRWVAV